MGMALATAGFFFYNDDYVLKDIANMSILTLNDNIHLMTC